MTRQQQVKGWYTAVVTVLLVFVALPVQAQDPQPAGNTTCADECTSSIGEYLHGGSLVGEGRDYRR